jgi:lipopolysaccharide export system permease protein
MSTFAQNEVGIQVLLKYYFYYLPGILYQMTPVAALLATVFTLSGLNKSNEMVALYSMGWSLARISAPILAMVAMISVFSFWMGDRLLPKFTQKKNYVWYVEVKNQPGRYATVKTNKIWYRSDNVLFYISTLDAAREMAYGINLYYFDANWNLIQMIQGQQVKMSGEFWQLKNGAVTLFTDQSSFPLTKEFQEKTITMSKDVIDLGSSSGPSDVQSLGELRQFIDKNIEAGLDTARYQVDYHSKIGFAFAAFVMSLMGIPFSVSHQRSGKGFANIGLCVGLAFLYWMFYSSSITLGRSGILPPMASAWIPNILMVGFSIFTLSRLKK